MKPITGRMLTQLLALTALALVGIIAAVYLVAWCLA